MLTAFHDKYDLGIDDADFGDEEARFQRDELMYEEINEFFVEMELGSSEAAALQEACDAVVTIVGTCVKFGWDFDKAFRLVMESNMSKGNKDGTFSTKDGKLQKGRTYRAPNLSDCV
jgi:hypothetical protein